MSTSESQDRYFDEYARSSRRSQGGTLSGAVQLSWQLSNGEQRSVRATFVDPDSTMHAVINAVIRARRRLASLGNRVELEYGHPIDRLFRETIRTILLGLRAQQPVKRRKRSS